MALSAVNLPAGLRVQAARGKYLYMNRLYLDACVGKLF